MELSQLADIGDLLGGLGVLASLVYVAIEIRSNTRASHHTAYHETVNQLLAGIHDLMGERWNDLQSRPKEELSETERFQLEAPIAAILFGAENLLNLKQRGHIDARMWENVEKNFYPMLKTEFIHTALQNRTGPLSRDLLKEVDSVM